MTRNHASYIARPLIIAGFAVALFGCVTTPTKRSDAYDPANNSRQHKPSYMIQATLEPGEMEEKTQSGTADVYHGEPPKNPPLHAWAKPTMDSLPTGIEIDSGLAEACNIPDAGAFFSTDSADLHPEAQAALDALAACFMTGPMKGHRLSITGHADPRGSEQHNKELGWQRAAAVAKHLETAGLSAQEMDQESAGESSASEDPERWPYDRKVVLDVGEGEAATEGEAEAAPEGDVAPE